MTEKTREMLQSALFEATFVVFGVVIALMANDWRSEQSLRHHSKVAMEHILDEIKANRLVVAEARDYHKHLVKMIAETPDMSWEKSPFSKGFIAPAKTYNSAWDSASATSAFEHRDYRQMLILSRVYSSQARYEQQADNSGNIIYQEIYQSGTQAVFENRNNLAALLNAFVYREEELLGAYDKTLSELEGAPEENS